MKVILRQDVDNVGLRGEVVDVARGYARNFLLPRKLAEPATPARVAEAEKVASHRARHEAQSFEQAQEISQRVGQLELRFDVKAGETGVLFGSVTPTDISDTLWERHKVRVDRRKIELAEPIKRIGRYEIPVELFQDVTVQLRTLVVPEGGELPPEEAAPVPEEEAAPVAQDGEAAPVADAAEQTEAEEAAEPPVRGSGPREGAPGEPGGSPATEEAALDRYSDEALDEAIAAAEQPERPEPPEEEQVPEDAFDGALDADTAPEASQER
jgi:large subunit ribosomal protein L9